MRRLRRVGRTRRAIVALPLALLFAAGPAAAQDDDGTPAGEAAAAVEQALSDKPVAPRSIGQADDDAAETVEQAAPQPAPFFRGGPIALAAQAWAPVADRLRNRTGLRLAFAYTALYQNANRGTSPTEAASGDVDIIGTWQPRGEGPPRRLAFMVEGRHRIGEITPSQMGGQIGSLLPTVGGFNVQDPAVVQLYWEQLLRGNRLGYRVGKQDVGFAFDSYRYRSTNFFFLNPALQGNQSVAYPANGFAAGFQYVPATPVYLLLGAANANSRRTQMSLDSLVDEWELFTAAELGVEPDFGPWGQGRYHVTLWDSDPASQLGRPAGQGFALTAQHETRDGWVPFLRYGESDGRASRVKRNLAIGLGAEFSFGRDSDVAALAFAWSEPHAGGGADQYVVEFFYRWQLTPYVQLTPDLQLISGTGRPEEDEVTGLFSLRFRASF